MVFDRTFCVRQISVVEDHGIILIRGGSASNKDAHRIYVFRLSEFGEDLVQCRSRFDVKGHRIDKSRGCHLFSLLKANDGHLKMGCVLGKKLLTFQWKHTAAWTSWCPNNDNDTVDGFVFLKVRARTIVYSCPKRIFLDTYPLYPLFTGVLSARHAVTVDNNRGVHGREGERDDLLLGFQAPL